MHVLELLLNYCGNALYAYRETGGSNLDLEDDAWDASGARASLRRDIYPNYDLILAITNYSATAPLTAQAKIHGFRGATRLRIHSYFQTRLCHLPMHLCQAP
jgi:hypothetical protein